MSGSTLPILRRLVVLDSDSAPDETLTALRRRSGRPVSTREESNVARGERREPTRTTPRRTTPPPDRA